MKIKTLILLSSLLCPIAFADVDIQNNENALKIQLDQVIWLNSPKFYFTNNDLENINRQFLARIFTNKQGIVTQVEILKSTELQRLDQKLVSSLKRSRLKPHTINGQAFPIIAELPIELISR